MKSQLLRTILLVFIALLAGYYIGVSKIAFAWNNFQPHIEISSKEPPASLQQGDASRMWVVLEKIEANFYQPEAINSDKIINGAITGMVSSLDDPYTMYLPPTQNHDFKQGLAGQFEGIGAELAMPEKDVKVVAPLDGSPAKKAGLKAGDIILKVNGEMINGLSLTQVVEKIRGPKGTEVVLTILHEGANKTSDIKIKRDTIKVKSVTTWTKKIKDIPNIKTDAAPLAAAKENEVVYIRLSQFGDSTKEEWLAAATDIKKKLQSSDNIKGIVLDLRNNPGGYLNDAVYIASEFIKDGTAVMQEDRLGKRQEFAVTGEGVLTDDVPVVVLINKGSASASEIVAGALRDHKRATLIGENSFGKGTIQQAEDLGGGAGIHITIAKWLTPDGNWVGNGKDGEGLKPDVTVKLDEKNPTHDIQLEKAIQQLLQ